MKKRILAVPALAALFGLVQSAHAAVPADVTTALTTMKTDGVALSVLVLGAVIAVLAIKFLRKAF